MNQAAGFEQDFLNFLAARSGAFDVDCHKILTRLVSASVNQHSCILLDGEHPDIIETLSLHPAIGAPGAHTPIILDQNRLYLARFYEFEKHVAEAVCLKNKPLPNIDPKSLHEALDRRFGAAPGNRQKLAALIALTRGLSIITGGPGTGKTSTVANLLYILLLQAPKTRVQLAAPTGKAAMRLGLGFAELEREGLIKMPEVKTLHRLLGVRRDGRSFRHGPDNPLQIDVLIVDEASMIDLPMMHRLLAALKPETRLILLGDPDQLPSVDTGNVLADLCPRDISYTPEFVAFAEPIIGNIPTNASNNRLSNAICQLDHSYRFNADSGIAKLAANIRAGSAEIPQTSDGSIEYSKDEPTAADLLQHWQGYLSELEQSEPVPTSLLASFDDCRVLCSKRAGENGVEAINQQLEKELETRGLKQPGQRFYPGRPILITENDYNLGLFNGDIGICLPAVGTRQQTHYLVHFPGPETRSFLASRLPVHETCFAMTVHKSQGSEFEHVTLILNGDESDRRNLLTNRELLYTAVTRARQSVTLCTTELTWTEAISRSAARISGMTSFLDLPPATIHEKLDKSSPDQGELF